MGNLFEMDQEGEFVVGQTLLRTMHIKELYDAVFIESGIELGLTQLEMTIVLFLGNHKEYNTARDLCRMRMIPKSNASNGIRLLERKGMLRIEYDPENKKIHRLYLTEKAEKAKEHLKKKQCDFLKTLFRDLNREEILEVDRLFKKLDDVAMEELEKTGFELAE